MSLERREPAILGRDCPATQIPSGAPVVLRAGAFVTVVQALGGSYTVVAEDGGMVRVDERDADALGPEYADEARRAREAREAKRAPSPPGAPLDPERVWEALRTVYDPEIPASIVELGLVYLCHVEPLPDGTARVTVRMTLTAPGCGIGPVLVDDVRRKVSSVPGVSAVDVDLVFDPPWDPSMMSDAARLQLGLM